MGCPVSHRRRARCDAADPWPALAVPTTSRCARFAQRLKIGAEPKGGLVRPGNTLATCTGGSLARRDHHTPGERCGGPAAPVLLLASVLASVTQTKSAGKASCFASSHNVTRAVAQASVLALHRCSSAGRETTLTPSATSHRNPIAQTAIRRPREPGYVQDGAREAAIVSAGAASHNIPSGPTAESTTT